MPHIQDLFILEHSTSRRCCRKKIDTTLRDLFKIYHVPNQIIFWTTAKDLTIIFKIYSRFSMLRFESFSY